MPAKKVIYIGLLAVYCLMSAEVCARMFWRVKNHQHFPFNSFQTTMLSILTDKNSGARPVSEDPVEQALNRGDELIHPYLGYVRNPRLEPHVSNFGFAQNSLPDTFFTPTGINVCLFGGSVAEKSWPSFEILESELAQIQAFKGKKINLINAAMNGYKQPQQLMALIYILSIGGRLDLVINLDGFNEVALPAAENIPNGVYPFFPRWWQIRTANVNDSSMINNLSKLQQWKHRRKHWAAMAVSSKLNKLATGCLIWNLGDQFICHQIVQAETLVTNNQRNRYVASGPPYTVGSQDALYRDLTDVWKRDSLMMKQICDARHIPYFHFLQPNQYVPGSKPIGAQEKEIAIREDQPYRPSVLQGYPLLKNRGEDLVKDGVNFYDLTMLFKNIDEPLYVDNCCHFNQKGSDLLMATIGKTIRNKLSTSQSPKNHT